VLRERRAAMAIFGISFLWGMTFIWMKQGIEAAERAAPDLEANWVAFLFFSARFVIATVLTLALLPKARSGLFNPDAVRGGAWLGLILSAGYLSQNVGITTVTPGVSAFLTSLYVVFTALIAISLGRQSITKSTVIGVLLATFGAGWIGGPPQVSLGFGEFLTIFSAYMFGAHIIATDRVTKENDPIEVTGPMMVTIMLLGALMLLALPIRSEGLSIMSDFQEVLVTWDFLLPLFLCAAFGSLVALLVLNVFQRDLPPIRAAIIYAFEPVWAGIASLIMGYDEIGFWFFLGAGALLIGNLVVEFEGLSAKSEEE
jgi:drug/metabolite transporter (DMT)-like permease